MDTHGTTALTGRTLLMIFHHFSDEDDRVDKAQFLHFIQRCENLIDDQYTLSDVIKAFDHVCGSHSADYQKFVEVLFNVAATKYPREDGRLDYQYANLLWKNIFKIEGIKLMDTTSKRTHKKTSIVSEQLETTTTTARQLQFQQEEVAAVDTKVSTATSPMMARIEDSSHTNVPTGAIETLKSQHHEEITKIQQAMQLVEAANAQVRQKLTSLSHNTRSDKPSGGMGRIVSLLLLLLLAVPFIVFASNGVITVPKTVNCVAKLVHPIAPIHTTTGCFTIGGRETPLCLPLEWINNPAHACTHCPEIPQRYEVLNVTEPVPPTATTPTQPPATEPVVMCINCGLEHVGT